MKYHALSAVLGLLALVVPAAGVAVAAAGEVPFSADLTVVFAGTDRGVRVFTVEGTASLMGPVTGEVRDQDRGPISVGTLFLLGVNGDRLFFSYEIAEGEPGLFGGFYRVEGGTGRFEGATGGGVIIGQDVAEGVFDVTLEGTLSF
jgi:hypothetical protein